MKDEQFRQLMRQSLTHEQGGVKVYEAALKCAKNSDLREEWTKYLEETRDHVQVLTDACSALAIDIDEKCTSCAIIEEMGKALVKAMEMALDNGDADAAEIVACECVVIAETKDHLDWELLSQCATKSTGERKKILQAACDEVEDQEDEHLYHSKGWCRELWIEALGMKGILPPPEERKHVRTAIGAARAQQAAKR